MKKLYKEVSWKKLLKMFYKGKITDQIIIARIENTLPVNNKTTHYLGLFIGTNHYNSDAKLDIDYLLDPRNKFAIYKNTKENFDMLSWRIPEEHNLYFLMKAGG